MLQPPYINAKKIFFVLLPTPFLGYIYYICDFIGLVLTYKQNKQTKQWKKNLKNDKFHIHLL